MNAISVKNLSFSYTENEKVINNVSFDIKKGQFVSFIGHNGSGKSTLAKLLVGLVEFNEGEIYIFDEKLSNKNIDKIRKKIGIVFQNPDNQFVGSTVEDDIAFGLENRQVEHQKMHEIVSKKAKEVGMENYLTTEPCSLSGGQKQRVAIAGVIALSPKILILDEATSMLDPKGKREINELIKKMRELDKELTVISITHDLEEASLSDYIYLLNKGEIVFSSSPLELFKNKETLSKYNLKAPFIFELVNKLKNEGFNIDSYDSEEVINYLCQLK
ncbi:MAG: energy-coupling factor transporter ATPase [Bacilli bacterium]